MQPKQRAEKNFPLTGGHADAHPAFLPLFKKTKLHMRKFKLRNAIVSGILTIAVSLLSASLLYAQDVGTPVHGKVTDSVGKPISGASVVNQKTGKGTSTDQNGNFTIGAVKGQVLQISF